ncbi:MAG: hypothetical protein ACPL3C_07065 [Pyrobaculum sp.]|jgi:hypothetical protein|uniref:Respiratory chain protein n=1 Tax=Pyrobaculum ferrireducens TaxID=1104324 RepID=G7VBA4_9CREN|nr:MULTISPECIES: hypothetical protein [Pyrobaculum]AET33601.1 hypothetical protein P186_2209 [Pyrobaculum ferrireducens]MCU7788173.1 hypothetical protein [Pyrobaculum sp. 3827-6]
MRLVYAYAGFSLGVALYFLVLTALGLRTPDISIGAARVNLFVVVAAAFVIFTLYVVYRLTERRS